MNSQSAQWRLGKLLYLFRATELTISCAVAEEEGNFGGVHGFFGGKPSIQISIMA